MIKLNDAAACGWDRLTTNPLHGASRTQAAANVLWVCFGNGKQ